MLNVQIEINTSETIGLTCRRHLGQTVLSVWHYRRWRLHKTPRQPEIDMFGKHAGPRSLHPSVHSMVKATGTPNDKISINEEDLLPVMLLGSSTTSPHLQVWSTSTVDEESVGSHEVCTLSDKISDRKKNTQDWRDSILSLIRAVLFRLYLHWLFNGW